MEKKKKALSPEMQAELIKTDMFNCRSPSAVLLSRIEKLKATWAHTGAPGRPVAPTVAPRRPIAVSRVQPTVAPVSMTMRGSAARSRSPRGRDGVPHPAMPPRKEQSWNDMSGLVLSVFFLEMMMRVGWRKGQKNLFLLSMQFSCDTKL